MPTTSHTELQLKKNKWGIWGPSLTVGLMTVWRGMDTWVLSTVPHAHVDITSVGGSVLERLPLVQCASVVETVDEGKIVLIMSQYAHKPDSKTIYSKSQLESFGSLVHDSAVLAGGHQVIVTHEGYVIPLHVRNGLCYVDMKPASHSDLEQYTHVFITLDAPWNPDIVNHEFSLMHPIPCCPSLPSRNDGMLVTHMSTCLEKCILWIFMPRITPSLKNAIPL